MRKLASDRPVDVLKLREAVQTPAGLKQHRKRMRRFTVTVPTTYVVTFSIETGHPIGTVRHLSISTVQRGMVPNPHAVWMIAEALGFLGGLGLCQIWDEALEDGEHAINVAQPLMTATADETVGHA